MFNSDSIQAALKSAGLERPLHFFDRTGSTNDDAHHLAEAGAPAGTLVIAGEQTAGRGRAGRLWRSPPGASLSMSLILRPQGLPLASLGTLAMLGGLAAAEALEVATGVKTELKWPNDVLLNRRKVGGVLVETAVAGDRLLYAVVGIGVNVGRGAEPPPETVTFPATSLEAEAGRPVGRLEVLLELVRRLELWSTWLDHVQSASHVPRMQLPGSDADPESVSPDLAAAWQARLAFKGETVQVETPEGLRQGIILGVTPEGALKLRLPMGEILTVASGDVRLRPTPS